MRYLALNEIIVGLTMGGAISAGTIDADLLVPPYKDMLLALRRGVKEPGLIDAFGLAPVEAARSAAAALENYQDMDWLTLLNQVKTFDEVGTNFERFARKLKAGTAIDEVEALGEVQRLSTLEQQVKTLDQVEQDDQHFQLSYWVPVDTTWGGLPEAGVLTLAGLPKTGKSRLAMLLVALKAIQEEHSLVFSLEMPAAEWKSALLEVCPWLKKPKFRKCIKFIHIYDGDEALSVDRMVAITIQNAAQFNLRLVVGDVAEMFLDQGADEPAMTRLWKQMASLSRRIRCCYLATAQFNDGAYQGGIPLTRHIRYGRMVVAYSSQIWCIYNPAMTWTSKPTNDNLPLFEGQSYIINWISRWGFGEQGSGAIRVAWNGKQGWGSVLEDYHPVAEIVG